MLTVGIDAEPHQPLPTDVLGVIALAEEKVRIAELTAAHNALHWDRILFCAKETVYKAWFPLMQRWLGFDDATVTIAPNPVNPAEGAFSARLLVSGPSIAGQPLTQFIGRWLVRDRLVIAAIATPTTQSGHSQTGENR
ncbi:MAG: 4'-phosphopantetheinyl transferase family protein [Gammaproteobacteria bacterium]